MPEAKITIRTTRDIQLKDGANWPRGYDLETTREELTRRQVPDDAYKVLREEAKAPTPAKPEAQKK
jgi:hypothetical protein